MGKKDKPVKPYKLKLDISLEGLEGVPKDTEARDIARNWLVKAVLKQGETSRGFTIQNHRTLKRIRDILEEAVKTKSNEVEFEVEDWRFFKRCWDTVQLPEGANEVLIRIDDKVREAVSNHDRESNDVELDENEKVVSSQEKKK